MATAKSVVFTANGKTQEAQTGDTQYVSGTITPGPANFFTINAANIDFQINSVSKLQLTGTTLAAQSGVNFSGDGSGLTAIAASGITTGTLATARGGTGVSGFTNHAVLLGGTSSITSASTGVSGQVFTSAGSGADGAYADTVTATFGSASLSTSTFTLNAANGVFQDVGLSIKLPSAGTYLVTASVRNDINTSSGIGFIVIKLQNSTDGTDIANSERMGANSGAINQYYLANTEITEIITVTASKTIKVLASRNSATTYAVSQVVNASDGRSRIQYVKIKP